jgi:16S rRNA (cytidine1402-2'-O)-methyltransferase
MTREPVIVPAPYKLDTMQKHGTLYVVATPIGNLEDITLRALRVLREVSLIAAEDTRVTRKLLSHYDIHTPMTAYHQHSRGRKAEELVERLESGNDIALVSDAGTPGISDPGHELIELAIKAKIPIVVIPGANAIITALAASGLPTARFAFEGFPPRKENEKRAFFRRLKDDTRTLVIYESPLRLLGTLKMALAELGDRRAAVVREATKIFEEIFRGTLSECIERFTRPKAKGEITIVIEGARPTPNKDHISLDIEKKIRALLDQGVSERDAVRIIAAETGLPRREIYSSALKMKKKNQFPTDTSGGI